MNWIGGEEMNPENELMAVFTLLFILCLVGGALRGPPWVWALAAFFGFASIMTQIEVVGK